MPKTVLTFIYDVQRTPTSSDNPFIYIDFPVKLAIIKINFIRESKHLYVTNTKLVSNKLITLIYNHHTLSFMSYDNLGSIFRTNETINCETGEINQI